MQKKHCINIAFHNFKIKCERNKTELTFQKKLILTIKYRTVNWIKIKYLMYQLFACNGRYRSTAPLLPPLRAAI